jgi:hypothetical protein
MGRRICPCPMNFLIQKNTEFERFVGTMLKLDDGRHSRRDMIVFIA